MRSGHKAAGLLGRRARERLKGPGGEWLRLMLVQILDRDEQGRVRNTRIVYDDDTVTLKGLATPEQLAGTAKPNLSFLLVWMTEEMIRGAKGEKK